MIPIGKGFGQIVQVAYLVEDIDVAMEHWLESAGLGPWTCFRNIELATNFEGRDFTMHIHEALAYMGELQIQLVQSLDSPETVTPYQDFIAAGRWGVHHMAFFAEDIDGAVAQAKAQGFGRLCAMRDKGDYRYYYCQSNAMPDVWIEFLESYPDLHTIFKDGIAAAADWDGSDPIRNFEYADL
jgi:methylmalonyl-CoA/ethylmalonyl-CoA epimerase